MLYCQLCLHHFLGLGGKLPRDYILVRLKLVHNLSIKLWWSGQFSQIFVEASIHSSPLEVFPQGKCCSFAIVCGHQPIVHTWPEFDTSLNLIIYFCIKTRKHRQELIVFPFFVMFINRSTTHFFIFQFAQAN